MTPDPTTSTSSVSVYKVTYAGINGNPAHAWLSVPNAINGRLSAIIEYPGYGGDPTAPSTSLAAQGFEVLDFIVNAPDWTSGNKTKDYILDGIGSENTYVFRTIIGNALRALLLLANDTHMKFKPTSLGVVGGSQGGALSLIVAALEPGLISAKSGSAVVSASPGLADFPACFSGQPVGPYSEVTAYMQQHPDDRPNVYRTLSYFDVVNFAPAIAAPVYMYLGLKDPVTRPSTAFAVANHLSAPHEVHVYPDGDHVPGDGFLPAYQWLIQKLK